MKKLIISLFMMSLLSAQSATVSHKTIQAETHSEYASIIIDSLWEQAGHTHTVIIPDQNKVSPGPEPEPKPKKEIAPSPKKAEPVVDGKLKISKIKGLKGSTSGKINLNKQENPLDKYRKKTDSSVQKSKGSDLIAKKLAENRAKVKSRMEQLKQQDQQDSQNSNEDEDLVKLNNKGISALKLKQKQALTNWKSKVQKTYQRWSKARASYIKRIPEYKESTFEFVEANFGEFAKEELKKPLSKAIKTDFHIIPGALDIPVRDQGRRPTCAAFTGIRAIETLINAKGKELDLSEQYFYWASKPECQQFPCAKRGSWITNGYDKSARSFKADIPLDKDCPYNRKTINGNETQIPLEGGCKRGVVQVDEYAKYYSLNDVYNALSKNSPIIAGFKLSPNFYKTKGLVTYKESKKKGSMDGHAAGHAVLLIGHMKLPKTLHSTEGKICFIVANSWSEGWGRGGFGCLTEKWVKEYKVRNPFIALTRVRYEE